MHRSIRFVVQWCAISTIVATLLAGAAFAQNPEPRMPLQQFAAETFFHGVPFEDVLAYGPAAVPELIAILGDPGREAQWANAAVMLAMLADPRGVDAVLAFIRDPGAGAITPYREWVRGNAVLALGYAANEGRNRAALQYLEEGLRPGAWARRGVRGAQGRPPPRAPDADVEEEEEEDPALNVDGWLTNQALVGLALSGTPEGRRALEQFRNAPGLRPRKRGVIDSLLQEQQRISQQGLRAYDQGRQRANSAPGQQPAAPDARPPAGAPGGRAPGTAPTTGPGPG